VRSAVLLLSGVVLVGGGIALIALEVPGRWILGPGMIVVGVALKLIGLLRDAQPPAATGGRTVTTLGSAAPERARPGANGRVQIRDGRRAS
jgi:hypothetical protein